MDERKNKTDWYFREHLEDYEQSPPESAWDTIARKMDERRKKRALLLIFRIAAGMAILLSTGIGYYFMSNRNEASSIAVISPSAKPVTRQNFQPVEKALKQTDEKISIAEQGTSVTEITNENEIATPKPDRFPKPVRFTYNTPLPELATSDENLVPLPLSENAVPEQILAADLSATDSLTTQQIIELLTAENNVIEEKAENKMQRWSLGGEVAPLYSHRSISSDKLQSEMVDNFNRNENGILAYAGGLRVAFSTGKRLSVQSGIYYSRYGQEKNQVQSVSNKYTGTIGEENFRFLSVTNSTGVISGGLDDKGPGNIHNDFDAVSEMSYKYGLVNANVYPASQSEEEVSLRQIFDYFEVPLIVKYKIIDRKLDFSFTGGLVTNFLIGNSVDMIQNGQATRVGETSDINNINYQGSIGMGLEYPVISNFAITIEPRFRYYLNPIYKVPEINVHPFSFGFFAGINYRF